MILKRLAVQIVTVARLPYRSRLGPLFLSGFAIAISIWIIGFLCIFQSLDGLFYDIAMRLSFKTNIKPSPSHVVLVEIPPISPQLSEAQLIEIVTILRRYHPRAIVLNYFPESLSQSGINQFSAPGKPPIIYGVPLEKVMKKILPEKLWPTPGALNGPGMQIGLAGLPEATSGIPIIVW